MNTSGSIQAFQVIDALWQQVEVVKKEPLFSAEVTSRISRDVSIIHDDDTVLKIMAEIIAYSQGAKSDKVSKMIEQGELNEAFSGFVVSVVSKMDGSSIIQNYWNTIKVIRFKKKIPAIIGCANALLELQEEYGSFLALLEEIAIPKRLQTHSDIDKFWKKFLRLKCILTSVECPFFRQTTELLYLLLTIGYDCIKPDRIIMNVAQQLGIVESTGKKGLIKTVKTIQEYALLREIRPSVIDFYFLVFGEQEWAKQFVIKKPSK